MADKLSTPPQPLAERLRFLVAERGHVQLGVVEDDLLAAADLIENLAKAYVAERDVLLRVQSESAPIPEGWKLVPVELTEPMRIAGYLYKPKLEARCLYRALLDAAPQVPSQDGGKPGQSLASGSGPVDTPAVAARDYSDKAWPFPTGRT